MGETASSLADSPHDSQTLAPLRFYRARACAPHIPQATGGRGKSMYYKIIHMSCINLPEVETIRIERTTFEERMPDKVLSFVIAGWKPGYISPAACKGQ